MAVVMVGPGSTIFTTPVICVRYDHVMTVVHWTLHWTWIIVSYCIDQECPHCSSEAQLIKGLVSSQPISWLEGLQHICWLAPAVSGSGVSIGIWPPLADGLRHSAGSGS